MLNLKLCGIAACSLNLIKLCGMTGSRESKGVDISMIPADELKAGDGPVLRAETQWLATLARHEIHNPTRAVNHEI